MKKIFRYVVLLIVVYLVVEIFVYFLTKTYYRDMNNYQILVKNPAIVVTECKVAKNKGYIEGTATNNSEEILNDIIIKFEFYDKQGVYVGTKYEEIEILNATEKLKFNIQYDYKNVAEIKIGVVKE